MGTEELVAAIRRELESKGRTQSWLAAEIARIEGRPDPYSQALMSEWLKGRSKMNPDQVFACERALSLRPGSLSRLLGYLPTTSRSARSVPEAIAAEPRLTTSGRRILTAVFEQLVAPGDEGTDSGLQEG